LARKAISTSGSTPVIPLLAGRVLSAAGAAPLIALVTVGEITSCVVQALRKLTKVPPPSKAAAPMPETRKKSRRVHLFTVIFIFLLIFEYSPTPSNLASMPVSETQIHTVVNDKHQGRWRYWLK
jgi:hypothetical protein